MDRVQAGQVVVVPAVRAAVMDHADHVEEPMVPQEAPVADARTVGIVPNVLVARIDAR